jgi:predicted nucleic acid-binding protein
MTKTGARQRCFLDSDVIISALIPDRGAAYALLTQKGATGLYTSPYVLSEVNRATTKHGLDKKRLELFGGILKMGKGISSITNIRSLVNDPNDEPIISATISNRCHFLVTYNLKDYQISEIKNRHNIIVLRPGDYLQHLRSLDD